MAATGLAKTTRPSVPGALQRTRLFERLDAGREGALVWISGPPGSGKTTLVASYIEMHNLPCLWYQFDRGDSEAATFFYYVGQAASAEAGTEALPLLPPEYMDDLETFSRRYFRELYARFPSSSLLVLDNYHQIAAASPLHDVLRVGLDEVPPGITVVMLSRSEAPRALARYRASQALDVIGWDDLQLTRSESDAIALQRATDLDDDDLAAVFRRSSGWPAALGLMPADRSGDYPEVLFDYLADEIFARFNEPSRDLLLSCSILPQITPSLAEKLTGVEDAGRLLGRLGRGGALVSERPATPEPLYEFHPLLREFLQRKMRETFDAESRRALHERAAALLLENGLVEDAIDIYLVEQEWDAAAAAITAHGDMLLGQGRAETMSHWFDDFPEEVLERDPWLLYWYGTSHLHISPRDSRRALERSHDLFESRVPSDARGRILAACGVVRAVLHEMDDLSLLDPWIERLDALLRGGELEPELETRAAYSLFAAAMQRRPDFPELPHWLDRACTLARQSGDSALRMMIEPDAAIAVLWTGHYPKAAALIDGMHQLEASERLSPLGLISLRNVEAMYGMLTLDETRCLAAVEAGLALAEECGIHVLTNQLLATGAAAHVAAGHLDAARGLLDRLEARTRNARRFDLCLYNYCAGWHALLAGETLAAYQHLKTSLRLAGELGMPFYEVICRLALVLILVDNDERKCATYLRRVHSMTRHINSHLLSFMGLIAYAHIAIEHGRRQSGLNALQYAFGLGREHGYDHFLGWQPEVMAELCVQALTEGIEVDYARELVRRRDLVPREPPYAVIAWPWRLRIETLGGFAVIRDGDPLGGVDKKGGRPLALLKELVARGGEASADEIAASLWPHGEGDYAYRSLTTTLHRLRRLLGADEAVVLRDGRLSLDRRRCWVDTWALQQGFTALERLFKGSRRDAAASDVRRLTEQLVNLYAGDFLPGDDELAACLAYREQLRARFVRELARVAGYWADNEAWDEAVNCCERGLERVPDREALYRALIRAQLALGRRAEALESFERCRAALRAAHQVEPSAETAALLDGVADA